MDVSTITSLIGTVGFPIVCVLALGFFVYKLWQQSAQREDKLMTNLTECRLVNEKAIETIALYADRLTHIENNVEAIKNDVVDIKQKID
jgi:phosphopantetheine adenylyltransferase